MNETKPHISSIDLLSKYDYQHHLLGAHKTCVHLHHQLLPSIWWVVKMFSIWLSRLFVVGCQDVLLWVSSIFCGGLSRSFVVGYQDLLWWAVFFWVAKVVCGAMSSCSVVGCQDVFYLVVKIVCGGLSRCSVMGSQDVLWLVLKIFCCERVEKAWPFPIMSLE